MPMKLFQQAQRVSRAINGLFRTLWWIDEALPAAADQVVIDPAGIEPAGGQPTGALRGDHVGQVVQRGQDRFAVAGGPEVDGAHHRGQERADRGEPARQLLEPLLIEFRIRLRHKLIYRGRRRPQLGLGHGVLDQIPHEFQRQARICLTHLQQHPHRAGELARIARHARVAAQLLILRLPLGLGHQVGDHKQVEQLEGIIDSHGAQREHRRAQQRQQSLALWRHPPQMRGLAVQSVRGQGNQPPRWHLGHALITHSRT
ncbi:hypothetical protein [Nocardia niigatensis]